MQPSPAADQLVSTLMRTQFISVDPQESLFAADRLMQLTRLRHLPVVRGGILVGVVSHRNVLERVVTELEEGPGRTRRESLMGIPVERVMQAPPEAVGSSSPLQRAAAQMLCFKIGFLPVVEWTDAGPRILGLLLESDLLRAAYDPVAGPG